MSKPYYDLDGITIYHADNVNIEWPKPDEVGLLLTDPPYGINYQSDRRYLWGSRNIANDETPFDPAPLLVYPRCVLFGAEHYAARLPISKGWIVWEKRGGMDSTDSGLRVADCELAWTNITGRHRVFNELWMGPIRREKFLHPTQKSINLMRWIVSQWTGSGDLVFDPYMGSGPIAGACADLGRRYIGIEIEEEYCEAAVSRLGQLTLGLEV